MIDVFGAIFAEFLPETLRNIANICKIYMLNKF